MSNIDLLLEPINGGRNQLPVIRVEDEVFVYDNNGLQTIPANDFPPRNSWKNVGKVVLKNAKTTVSVSARAYALYLEKYRTWDAIKSNPVIFMNDLLGLLTDMNFERIEDQDWENVKVDVTEYLGKSSEASRASGRSVTNFLSKFW